MCCRFRSKLHSFGTLDSQVEWNIPNIFSIVLLHPHTRTLCHFFVVFEGSKALTVALLYLYKYFYGMDVCFLQGVWPLRVWLTYLENSSDSFSFPSFSSLIITSALLRHSSLLTLPPVTDCLFMACGQYSQNYCQTVKRGFRGL